MSFENIDIPERNTPGLYATAAFFQNINDIDVYIEDTAQGYRKLFSNIVSRALSVSDIGVDRIFPLGDRGSVISAARGAGSSNAGQSNLSIFLVDGDLYLLSGEREDIPDNVVVLDRYCIENYLVDFEAWLELMDEESTELSKEKIAENADFSGWVYRNKPTLRKLFEEFAVSHYLESGLKTVSNGHKSICKNSLGEICIDKVEDEISRLSVALEGVYGEEAVRSARENILNRVRSDTCFLHTYVSAKDYILPLLLMRFRAITKSKASNINIKIRLSKKCDVSSLEELFREVIDRT